TVRLPSGTNLNSATLVPANGRMKSSRSLTRSFGRLSVIVMRPSPTSLLPDHLKAAPVPAGAPSYAVLAPRIRLEPRGPRFPVVKVIHLCEHLFRWRGDRGRPSNAEGGGLPCHCDEQHDDDQSQGDGDLREHGGRLRSKSMRSI